MTRSIAAALSAAVDHPSAAPRLVASGGGAFGQTARLDSGGKSFFVKSLPTSQADALEAEADGLCRLARSDLDPDDGALRVPAVFGLFDIEDRCWLMVEWLDLQPLSRSAAAQLGQQLAIHHQRATAELHGLDRDNWIGGTRQSNRQWADWTRFLFEERLGPLIDQLNAKGFDLGCDATQALRAAWTDRFSDYRPMPSLLHGDLWSGNAAMRDDGTPIVYDPAVYFGDREYDLAMAALFGGFGEEFFSAYESTWPLDHGWAIRRGYYQLYHVLNHALLFGGAYVVDARHRIETLIRA
ncbi:MAG: fructosamine kinase family protein [Pseudomonadota bacterium]